MSLRKTFKCPGCQKTAELKPVPGDHPVEGCFSWYCRGCGLVITFYHESTTDPHWLEVEHAEKGGRSRWSCSACGHIEYEPLENCPSCGADMPHPEDDNGTDIRNFNLDLGRDGPVPDYPGHPDVKYAPGRVEGVAGWTGGIKPSTKQPGYINAQGQEVVTTDGTATPPPTDGEPLPPGPEPGELWFCNKCGKAVKAVGVPNRCPHCGKEVPKAAYEGLAEGSTGIPCECECGAKWVHKHNAKIPESPEPVECPKCGATRTWNGEMDERDEPNHDDTRGDD